MPDINAQSENKKSQPKPRLGRGLGSLLGGQGPALNEADTAQFPKSNQPPAAPKASHPSTDLRNNSLGATSSTAANSGNMNIPLEARVWQIQVEKLTPSKLQPRTVFEKDKLDELASSIRQHGILQPITARKLANGTFEIIAGERRWRAAQLAGLLEVPVIMKTLSHRETLELAIIENIQREDLSPLEEAEAYQRLMNEFTLTQQQVSEKVGKERATVANALRLLGLPADTKEFVSQGLLSPGHCKVLLGLEEKEAISKWARKAIDMQLSVRKLEQELAKIKKSQASSSQAESDSSAAHEMERRRAVGHLQEQLQKIFGTRVTIDYQKGKGKLSVSFYSDDELTEIVEKMRRGN